MIKYCIVNNLLKINKYIKLSYLLISLSSVKVIYDYKTLPKVPGLKKIRIKCDKMI